MSGRRKGRTVTGGPILVMTDPEYFYDFVVYVLFPYTRGTQPRLRKHRKGTRVRFKGRSVRIHHDCQILINLYQKIPNPVFYQKFSHDSKKL